MTVIVIRTISRLINEIRHDPKDPWYLREPAEQKRRPLVSLYGALRRSGVMLRVSYLVLLAWWRRPYEPEIPSNGSRLISTTLEGVMKPLLWIVSVVVAGIVGSDYDSLRSSYASSNQLAIWIFVALWVIVVVLAYQWWRLLDRMRKVLVAWVIESRTKSQSDRHADDLTLFGYILGDHFRSRFNCKSVRFLAIISSSGVAYVTYFSGRH